MRRSPGDETCTIPQVISEGLCFVTKGKKAWTESRIKGIFNSSLSQLLQCKRQLPLVPDSDSNAHRISKKEWRKLFSEEDFPFQSFLFFDKFHGERKGSSGWSRVSTVSLYPNFHPRTSLLSPFYCPQPSKPTVTLQNRGWIFISSTEQKSSAGKRPAFYKRNNNNALSWGTWILW